MKFFVTGVSGYIGRNLIRHIQEIGSSYVNYDLASGYDILDANEVAKFMTGCEAVIHLGAIASIPFCKEHPNEAIEINVHGTLNVVCAASERAIPLVFASTLAAKNPETIYGLTKRIGEEIVLGAGGVVIRAANVYGGYGYLENKTNALSNFVNAKKIGEVATIQGDGSAKRDFVHVDDVCRALIAGAKTKPGIYEICTGRETSILELAELIGVKYEFAPPRKQLAEEFDKSALSWEAEVKLEDGLKRLIESSK